MRFRPLVISVILTVLGVAATGCQVEFGGGPAGVFTPARSGVLTVATETVPSAGFWTGTRAHPAGGFEYGLARAMADRFGLGKVEIRTVPFEKMITGDLAGADLGLRQLTPTGDREQYLDFSVPYLSAAPGALVRAGEVIPDMKTAKGLSWAVPAGTTLVGTLEDLVNPARIHVAADRAATVQLVEQGRADAALFDLPVALALAHDSRGRLAVAAQFNGAEALAAALPKGSPNLEAVNSAIRAFASDGTLSSLAERWLGTTLQAGSFTVPDVPLIR